MEIVNFITPGSNNQRKILNQKLLYYNFHLLSFETGLGFTDLYSLFLYLKSERTYIIAIFHSWKSQEAEVKMRLVMTGPFKFNKFACIWNLMTCSIEWNLWIDFFFTFFYTLSIFWKKSPPHLRRMDVSTDKNWTRKN